jgi:3-deoxy-D-arabino-heptulosonate 7-phosphate (DAHP) synthase
MKKKTKAEEQITKIEKGVTIIASKASDISLVALDKNLMCGPCSFEEFDNIETEKLEKLGWEYDEEQECFSFYTGHG